MTMQSPSKSRRRSATPQVVNSTGSRRRRRVEQVTPDETSTEEEELPRTHVVKEEGEGEWEDDVEREPVLLSSSTSSPKSTRRRRNAPPPRARAIILPRSPRGQQVSTNKAIPPIYTPPKLEEEAQADAQEPERIWEDAPRHIAHSVKATIRYSLDILKPALQLMKWPLVLIIFLLLLAMLLNSVAGVFSAAFAPFCYIPGVSTMAACQWINHPGHLQPQSRTKEFQRADYPALIDLEAKTFDQLLDDSMSLTGSLALKLKKTEVATKDLVTLVRLSDLASKDVLAETLVEFTRDAGVTAEGLQKLSAKFNGALDNIMAVNDYAVNRVAKARNSEPKTLVEKVNAKMPWAPALKDVDAVVLETFKGAMDMLSSQLERLILFAQASYRDLNKLEETLLTLHEIVQRENDTVVSDKDELLQQLWTKLGGNRKELKSFQRHLKLLKDLASYKKQAQAHIVAALHTLQGMNQEMDDIRERVAAPDLTSPQIAPEVHMKSIQLGLKRLKESRVRARELDQQAMRKILGVDDVRFIDAR